MHKLSKKGLLAASGVTLILSLLFVYNWRQEHQQLRDVRVQTVETTADMLADLIEKTVNENLLLVYNHKNRVEYTEGEYFVNFPFETHLLISVKPAFLFFEWVDEEGIIQLAEPYRENRETIGLNIFGWDDRIDYWLQMEKDSIVVMTPWIQLMQGGGAFLVDAPIYFKDEFHGSLTVGMDFTEDLDDIMTGREIVNLELKDSNGYLFYSFKDSTANGTDELNIERSLNFTDGSQNAWSMRVSVNDRFYSGRPMLLTQVGLTFRLLVAVLFGLTIYFMISAFKSSRENKSALNEKEVLISEIHHRVKNNLAVISSLIEMQWMEAEDQTLISNLQETQNRIQSIAGVHELLYGSETFSEIPFNRYLEILVEKQVNVHSTEIDSSDFSIDCEITNLNITQAVPLGLLMSELIANSFKHAFQKTDYGNIRISIKEDESYLDVHYSDNGPGFDRDLFEREVGLGLTIIKTLLSQLEAEFILDTENGFDLKFRFQRE